MVPARKRVRRDASLLRYSDQLPTDCTEECAREVDVERGGARETLEARFDVLDPTQVETLGIRAGIREFFEVNAACLVPGDVMDCANRV